MIVGTADQLTKVLKFFTKITEEWISPLACTTKFCDNWYKWAKDNEEAIATIATTLNADLPAKIQCLISQICQE